MDPKKMRERIDLLQLELIQLQQKVDRMFQAFGAINAEVIRMVDEPSIYLEQDLATD